MAIDVSINTPLTAVQSELTATVGSMKNLLTLPKVTYTKIPKDKQISLFDFILKILEVLGVNPKFLFDVFLDKFFDEGVIVEKILGVFATMSAKVGKDLSSKTTVQNPNSKVVKSLEKSNYSFLNSKIGGEIESFFSVLRMKIAQDLTMMVFGKSKDPATNAYMNQPGTFATVVVNPDLDDLVKEAVCGAELFSLSNNPSINESDLEYNRIQLLEKVEKGVVEYKVSCQNVEVTLPEMPKYIFGDASTSVVTGNPVTDPAQSLKILIQEVGNQVQTKNEEKNANSASAAFSKNLIEKIIQYASTILRPVFEYVFIVMGALDPTIGDNDNDQNEYYGYNKTIMTSTCCDILNNPADENKKEMAFNLCNALLQMLLGLLMQFLIGKIKELAKNYFARKALEKLKRKQEQLTMRFKITKDVKDASDKVKQAEKMQAALKSVKHILEFDGVGIG